MAGELTVALGLASSGAGDRLSVWLVEVSVDEDGEVAIACHEPWRATKGRDEASQLIDAHDTIRNALDRPKLGKVATVAVKRTETGPGRASTPYDRKVRFEGAAMLAAHGEGKRYMQYRTNQLGPGAELRAKAQKCATAPSDAESLDALAAACTALCHLGEMPAD